MIKRLLYFILILVTLTGTSVLADVIPQYSYNIKHTGIGTFKAPKEFIIYENPNVKSKILKVVRWDETGFADKTQKESDIFVAFLPKQLLAYCAVDDEIDGWVKIFYSQRNGLTGWVQTTPTNRFTSWLGFYMILGRRNGVYIYKDMQPLDKRIMSAPDANSQKISEFVYPKFIKLTLVRGNWMMVKVLDIGDTIHVGWLRWRDDNGKFLAFPYLTKH